MAQVNIEIDGRALQVPAGSTVMDAANQLGIYVPHFCYHKKLSIAANCRMCLVQVEKAPKPLPACATPVTEGMKVQTHSEQALTAQKGVMEFLLINHPLDCPICDQGGECQLQDLAVGYGASNSRYQEEKRVVFHKNVGPLISMEEMTRCIHCTRCVRFGQEIAGIMELGMVGRGEHSEILSFVGRTVDSELSGNMIDLCPVGALTSKPFRYKARTWELARRKSVSPHDSLGSNLVVQVKGDQVLRVLPFENESINECWLSDRDRFSYEGLNAPDRLTTPMVKQDGEWKATDWQTALNVVAKGLADIKSSGDADAIAALVSPHSTLEEMVLAAHLVRSLGSDSVDFRLRQSDFRADAGRQGAPWLGMPISDLNTLDRIVVIGSFLRNDHPLLAARLRYAVKKGGALHLIHSSDDNPLMPVAGKAIVAPSRLVATLAEVVAALADAKGAERPQSASGLLPGDAAKAIAASVAAGGNVGILLGNFAVQHPEYSSLHAWAQELARLSGGRLGVLGEAANSVGGYLAGAVPTTGANARSMFEIPKQAYLLINVEPELDCADPAQAMHALGEAKLVVAMSPYRHRAIEYATVMLPIAPFTETSGTFVNCEGRAQGFNGVVPPYKETRPGWKVLRVLGTMLGLQDFEFDTSEAVRDTVLGDRSKVGGLLSNAIDIPLATPVARNGGGVERIAEIPLYHADSLVRRASALQQTADARRQRATMNSATLGKMKLVAGAFAKFRQANGHGTGEAMLTVEIDDRIPDDCIRLPAALPTTAGLGSMTGALTAEPLA
jgi:NADH-quinone oxidoreductase subunit G